MANKRTQTNRYWMRLDNLFQDRPTLSVEYAKVTEKRGKPLPEPNQIHVMFGIRDNFVTCVAGTNHRDPVSHRRTDVYGMGPAKRNPVDPEVPMRGMGIALYRALDSLSDELTHNGR